MEKSRLEHHIDVGGVRVFATPYQSADIRPGNPLRSFKNLYLGSILNIKHFK